MTVHHGGHVGSRSADDLTARSGELSRGEIAAAAIGLADACGLRPVTMRAVADEAGISAAGLYRYVLSRDELIAALVDAALADMMLGPVPDGDWEHELQAVAHELLRVHVAHPWLGEAALGSGPAGPNALGYFDRCPAIMAAPPASTATKMEELGMLTGVVSLFARPAASEPHDPQTLLGALDPQAHPPDRSDHRPRPAGAPARPLPAITRQHAQRTADYIVNARVWTPRHSWRCHAGAMRPTRRGRGLPVPADLGPTIQRPSSDFAVQGPR